MSSQRRTRNNTARELKELAERSSALMCALFVLVTLLFSASLPEGVVAIVAAVTEPSSPRAVLGRALSSAQPEAEPTEEPLFIRLADVDKDVSPEVLIRLINIESIGDRLELAGDEPSVLIYHTHDTEAYRQTEEDVYSPSGNCRTEDDAHNVYAVGEELVRILREQYGIIAVHANEKHEKPLITTAYSRSLETMVKYKALYPSLTMFIDLHRDGVADTGYEDDFVTVEGKECARMMFVVGTGKSGKTSQFGPEETEGIAAAMPDFESNYALAVNLTETLLSYNDRFMRNIRIKSGKYNQQVSNKCLLVEVGHNGNTLEQAKNSMVYLAKAIYEITNENNG